jgi:hypothetical protein
MVDHPRPRPWEAQTLEQAELERFRGLYDVRVVAVDHPHAVLPQVGEIVQRVEDRVAVAAEVRRRAHPIEYQRIRRSLRRAVEAVARRVDARVGHAAPVQLLKQRPEPVGMLVVDGDRTLRRNTHGSLTSSLDPRGSQAD